MILSFYYIILNFNNFIGSTPQVFCDNVSSKFRGVFDSAGIQYTDFIRTTEDRHKVGQLFCFTGKQLLTVI